MNKYIFSLIALFATSTPAFAENVSCCNTPCCEKPDPCDCFECEPSPVCQPPRDEAYNAPFRIGVCWDLSLAFSFIYWDNIEDGLALGDDVSAVSNTDTILNSSCVPFDYCFKPGFKIGFGINFDWDNWDFYAEYTWMHNDTNTSKSTTLGLESAWFLPVVNEAIDTLDVSSVNSEWELDFDMLDFQLGRVSYNGCRLLLRPHFGGRAVWTRQRYTQTLQLPGDNTATSQNDFDSWLFGFRGGLDTRWNLCYAFYIYGNVAWSLLFTDFDSINISQSETATNLSTTYTCDEIQRLTTNMDLSIGMGWGDFCDSCDRWFLTLKLGYDFLVFMDQNVLREKYGTNNSSSNLYFHGLNFSAKVDF